MNSQPFLLVYLDAYHLGDPLFLRGIAGDVQAHVGPLILVHGSGEEAERAWSTKYGTRDTEYPSRPRHRRGYSSSLGIMPTARVKLSV